MEPFSKTKMSPLLLKSDNILRYNFFFKVTLSDHQFEPISCTAMSWLENVLLFLIGTHNYTTDLCEHEVAKELNISLLPDWRLHRCNHTE